LAYLVNNYTRFWGFAKGSLALLLWTLVSMPNKKILFISYYFEILKAYRPYIEQLEDVYVYATTHSVGDDYTRTLELLETMGVNYEINHSVNMVDNYLYTSKNKIVEYFHTVFAELKTNRMVDQIFKKIQPSIIVVAADKRELERLIIRRSKKLNIKTICLQWSLGPITEKALIENKHETLLSDYKKDKNIQARKYNTLSKLSLIYRRMLGLNTKVYANCYGGGDADILAVMGKGARKFFVQQGIPEKKIMVLGNALIEKQLIEIDEHIDGEKILESIGLKHGDRFVLYCTGYLKKGYYNYTKKEDLFQERKNKINELLRINHDCFIVVKLHPREILSEFKKLENVSNRLIVIKDIDVNALLPYCEFLFTRQSTTVIYALSFKKPVLTHDVPPMPMGSYYKDIGGTIHADAMEEIGRYAKLISDKDIETHMLMEERRKKFMLNHLNINEDLDGAKGDMLPAVEKLNELMEDLY